MTTETYEYQIEYRRDEDDDTDRRFRTMVRISAGAPITDVADIANDRLYSRHPEAQVIDEGLV